MKTIAFCTYGHSSTQNTAELLIGVAQYLVHLGKKVFLMDCNLPSPTLHLKTHRAFGGVKGFGHGLLDYLLYFQDVGRTSDELETYVRSTSDANLFLLPAGDAPSEDYTSKLLALDFRQLFPEKPPIMGVGVLLYIGDQTEAKFQPDYVLVDLPPMISDLGIAVVQRMADLSVWVSSNDKDESAGMEFILQSLRTRNPERVTIIVDGNEGRHLPNLCSSLGTQLGLPPLD